MASQSTGMIVDGIAASEAIDTSGEVLDVKGCDISSLPVDGILNFEHRGEDAPGHTDEDNVGKILVAKKIFRESDCEGDRQRKYWKMIELPFIYMVARLFDGAGHRGAQAMAAQIRDHIANDEEILIRFSIEGSTLKTGGPGDKRLERSYARKVACTVRPCNRSCYSGVIADPNAPPGWPKDPEGAQQGRKRDELEDVLKRGENADSLYLGGSVEVRCNPVVEDPLSKSARPRHPLWGVPRAHGVAPHITPRSVAKVEPLGARPPTFQPDEPEVVKRPPDIPGLRAPPRHPAVDGAHVGFLTAENPRRPSEVDGDNKDLEYDLARMGLRFERVRGRYDDPENSVMVHGIKPQDLYNLGRKYGQESVVLSKGGQNHLLYTHGPKHGKMFSGEGVSVFDAEPDNYFTTVTTPKGPVHFSYNVDWEKPGHVSALGIDAGHQVEAHSPPQHQVAAAKSEMRKALEAGSYNAAPSALVGGAALQREDSSLRNRAKATLRDWDRISPFRDFLKTRMPEADPEFVQRFADMVEVHRVPKRVLLKREDTGPLTIRGKTVRPRAVMEPTFDEQKGVLHTQRGSFPIYVPSRDPNPSARESFSNVMDDPHLHAVHARAMKNWARVNKRLRDGKLPPEVVMHATLFSQNSPNTPVPHQELMYSHLVDEMKDSGVDARDPRFGQLKGGWFGRDQPRALPEHSRKYFERIKPEISLGADSVRTDRKKGDIGSYMLPESKWEKMAQYHQLHGALVGLVDRHRDDARSAVAELMDHKRRGKLWAGLRERAIRNGRADPGPYQGPNVPGLAPKTARYMYGMIGGSNVVVPDTHFVRHLFGLDKVQDGPTSEYLKNVLWSPASGHVLDGIDRFYEKNHPAVQHVKQHPEIGRMLPEGEGGAIFPAFWRHWLAIAPHEASRGMGQANLAFNQATTHEPYWEAIAPHLRRSERPADTALAARTAAQHLDWARRYGEGPAMLMYFSDLVPQLLGDDEQANPRAMVRKFEVLSIELRKAAATARAPRPTETEQESPEIDHAGQKVRPGSARSGPNEYALLHAAPDHFVAVPKGREGKHGAGDVVRLLPGPGLKVDRWPVVTDAGTKVDADKHGDDLNKTKEQRELLHGLDFAEPPADKPSGSKAVEEGSIYHWRRGPKGLVFVKPDNDGDAEREVGFHNLARDFFGLGDYTATAALARHPRTGRKMAVIEGVDGEHGRDEDADQRATLRRLESDGTLDKLGLMDVIANNYDRHHGNYMFTHSEPGLKLYDHGDTFEQGTPALPAPGYVAQHHNQVSGAELDDTPLHPEARKWLEGLDEDEFAKHLAANRYSEEAAADAVFRLGNLKEHLRQHPELSRRRVYRSPAFDAKTGVRFAHSSSYAEIAADLAGVHHG